tara:strand:- start:145 stop:561 length:417 start_codon:yes stop_codon:yes gene_type:complete
MPLTPSIRKINPLDLNHNKTIGIAFPLDKENLNQGTLTIKEQIKTNLVNLCLTEKGERLFLPKYGVGLKKLLFQNNIDTISLNNTINQQIQIYLPQVTLIDTVVEFVQNQNTLYIKIIYRYNLDGTTDAIQMNFNDCK